MTRPIVGTVCDVRSERRTLHFVFEEYTRRIERAGGLPLLLPPLAEPEEAARALRLFDALVIPGGEDLDPRLYGEEPLPTTEPVPSERQAFDLAIAREVLASRLPVLGICYGCQLLAVASGGALWQDIPSQVDGSRKHTGRHPNLPRHAVDVTPGSRLHGILGGDRVEVNSAHHQAPRRLGSGLVATAVAEDGVIEGFEATGDRFLIGVEWHPELMDEPASDRLFAALVQAATNTDGGE